MRRILCYILFLYIVLSPVGAAALIQDAPARQMELTADSWIEPGHIRSWYSLTSEQVYIQVHVSSGPGLVFFICDRDNYDDWRDGYSSTRFHIDEDMTSKSMIFDFPYYDEWRVVFYNDRTTSQYLTGWVGLDPPPFYMSPAFPILVVSIVGMVAGVVGVLFWRNKKKPKTIAPPSPQYDGTLF